MSEADRARIDSTIAALTAQRAVLGDAVVDTVLASLRAQRAALDGPGAAAAESTATPLPTLRQVSILVLDIVGSTRLSQRLDPEQISQVMDGALAALTAIVDAHQGEVLQYAGDNLLAAFGAQQSREDDAERAVRAGLALLTEGRAQGDAVRRRHGPTDFDVRVGIHTGSVLLGGGVAADGSIRGHGVAIAARMEQTAPAGGLRISHGTYRHVRGLFDVLAQPPQPVPGVDAPVASYLVQRAKPRAFRVATRGIEGVETRMVGRQAELAQLQAAFVDGIGQRRLRIVTVVAEAGLGKSRLLYEFLNWVEARPEAVLLLQGRAHAGSRQQPYGLLRDVLADRLQIADGDDLRTARRALLRGLRPVYRGTGDARLAQANVHLLGHLIGLDHSDSPHLRGIRDDGRQLRQRAFHAALQALRHQGAREATPLLLLLDDLHWADDGSLDFLDHLAEHGADLPLLVLALSRPSLFEQHPERRALAAATRLDLAALDSATSRALAAELLQRLPDAPEVLRRLVTDGAEGNPFYMEELVKMLVDDGAIAIDGEHWRVQPERLLAAHVPDTLTGVLQARLDSVPAPEKRALQQAAVVGPVFWDQALAAIDVQSAVSLPALSRRALVVRRQQAAMAEAGEYSFSHQLLHQVTYDTVLRQLRRRWHATTARWLAGLPGARANDFLALAADHFERAGEPGPSAEFHARAAHHAAERFAHDAVMHHVDHGLRLLDTPAPDDPTPLLADPGPAQPAPADPSAALRLRWRLLDSRERTLGVQGQRGLQREAIDALAAVADALDDDRLRGEVAWRRCDLALRGADYAAQAAAARQAQALAARTGDDALALRAQQRLAIALGELGDWPAAQVLGEAGRAQARQRGWRPIEALYLNLLSAAVSAQGDLQTALALDAEKLALDRALGNLRSEAVTLGNLGESWLRLGSFARARQHIEDSLARTHALGDRTMGLVQLLNLAELLWRQGEPALAQARATDALAQARASQNPESEARALGLLGLTATALQRPADAEAAWAEALAVAKAADDEPMQHEAAGGLAQQALQRGDLATALALLAGTLPLLAGDAPLSTQVQLVCHSVLAQTNDPRAGRLLTRLHDSLQTQAAALRDPALRADFLGQIDEHRQITQRWALTRPPAPPA